MALAGRPQLLLLDEPAAGLSPAERVALTEPAAAASSREITLIIIEHDMDIALRVAERVTMMHDGSVVVEGTPAEIRANELRPRPLPGTLPWRVASRSCRSAT